MIKKPDYSEGRDTRVMLPNNHANIVSRFLAILLSKCINAGSQKQKNLRKTLEYVLPRY